MKWFAVTLLLASMACDDWDAPSKVTWQPVTYRVQGSVLSGEGGQAAATVTVQLFEAGCVVPAPLDSLIVRNGGSGFVASWASVPFSRPLCARVRSDTWPGDLTRWDEIVVSRDSIFPNEPVHIDLHYDFAFVQFWRPFTGDSTISLNDVAYEITDDNGTRSFAAASIPRLGNVSASTGTTGRLTFSVRISAPHATALGNVSFDARPDMRWTLSASILPSYNRNWCFCRVDAFPIHGPNGLRNDSLFVFSGGGPISSYWVN